MAVSYGNGKIGTDSYDFLLYKIDPLTFRYAPLPLVTGLKSPTYTPPTSLASGQYKAFVRAFVNGRPTVTTPVYSAAVPAIYTEFSNGVEFAVGGRPIVNSVPSSNIQRPTISWAAVGGASKYEVYISGTPVIRQQVTSTSYTVATALSPGKYTVWVRAFDTVGNKYGGWSNPVEWTIVAGNLAVISPIANSTVQTPTISWTLVQGSSSYEIFIATKASPGTAVFRLAGITSGSYQVSTPLAPGQYRVWMRALSSSSNTYGAWSVPVDWTISSTTLIGNPLDFATELVLAVVPNKLSELVNSSTVNMTDFDLTEHPTAPVVVAESAEDSAIQIKAVAADILPIVRQPAVLEANEVQEMDNVLAGWNNHAWWDEAVQSSAARNGATVGENGATSSSTSSASAVVLSALLMLVPKSIRRKRQE